MKAGLWGGIAAAAFLVFAAVPANAMPPFAQAYGVKCSLCHTQVPALNSYGRYVQRTGYASLDPATLRRAFPLWFGENTSYDSLSSGRTEFGNAAIHAVGPIGNDWTYHVHQWIVEDGEPGNIDTIWLAYNNIFHRDGHIFVGDIEAPAPSPYSQWMDLAGFTTPEILVGEHQYELDGNRWGAKFGYFHRPFNVEFGWLGSGNGWGGISDFSNNTDKTIQYKLAYANGFKPIEYGFYGSRGSWPLSDGTQDQYSSLAAYIQNDPVRYMPGVLAIYQREHDANPAPGIGSTWSTATTFELYEALLDDRLVISARHEFTNDGLGTLNQTGNFDVSYQVVPYVHIYFEHYVLQHSFPGWRYMIWWTTPLRNVK